MNNNHTPTTPPMRQTVVALPQVVTGSVTVSPSDTGEGLHTRWHYPEESMTTPTTRRPQVMQRAHSFSDSWLSLSSFDSDITIAGSTDIGTRSAALARWSSLPPSSLAYSSSFATETELPATYASPGGRSIFPTTPPPNLESMLLGSRSQSPMKTGEDTDTMTTSSVVQPSSPSPRPLQRSPAGLRLDKSQSTHVVLVPNEFTPEAIASRQSKQDALIEQIQFVEMMKLTQRDNEVKRFMSVLSSQDGDGSSCDSESVDLYSEHGDDSDVAWTETDELDVDMEDSVDRTPRANRTARYLPVATNDSSLSNQEHEQDEEATPKKNKKTKGLAAIAEELGLNLDDETDTEAFISDQAFLAQSFSRAASEPVDEDAFQAASRSQVQPILPINIDWDRATPPPNPLLQYTATHPTANPVTPTNADPNPYHEFQYPHPNRGRRRSHLNINPNLPVNPNFHSEVTPSPAGPPPRSFSEQFDALYEEEVTTPPPRRLGHSRTNSSDGGGNGGTRFSPYPSQNIEPNASTSSIMSVNHHPVASSSTTQLDDTNQATPRPRQSRVNEARRGRRLGRSDTVILEPWDPDYTPTN